MKKTIFLLLSILLLFSCESKENQYSRMAIDKYTRKLNSMLTDIINSREEEGTQSRLTLNNFYDRYTARLEDFNNDLEFETISEKYESNRDNLIILSRNTYEYLINRKLAIINVFESTSAFSSAVSYKDNYDEYMADMESSTSFYSVTSYYDMASKSLDNYFEEKSKFISGFSDLAYNLICLDSIGKLMDSLSVDYNASLVDKKLEEKIIIPKTLNDSINDWMWESSKSINELYSNLTDL